jgi:hypothetical protein
MTTLRAEVEAALVASRENSRSLGCAPPDFLWSLAALANLKRLSLLKAAHAVMDRATYRKSGSG